MVHLKDFSLVSPALKSNDILQAIKIAIPAEAIEQAIALVASLRVTQTLITSTISSLSCNCYELLVERFDERCVEKLN